MKRKKLLPLLSIIGILSLGATFTSCSTGEPIKGPTGDKGPVGDKGEDGKDGVDGEDGKDGSSWLSGSSKPTNSLGKDGDYYLNTSTNDLYFKENGEWKFLSSINGEDGEDGSDGTLVGEDGKNAYSNTFLPLTGGYVRADKGSALEGETITFIVTPLEDTQVESLVLNEQVITLDKLTPSSNRSYTYQTTMVKNGYVVSANFSDYNPLKSLKLSSSSTQVKVGGTVTFDVVPTPSNASDLNIVYEITSGSDLASIEGNTLTALGVGEVKVVAKSNDIVSNEVTIKIIEDTVIDPNELIKTTIDELNKMDPEAYNNNASKDIPQQLFEVTGKVKAWYGKKADGSYGEVDTYTEYGNFYLEDVNDSSKVILVYGLGSSDEPFTFHEDTGLWSYRNNKSFIQNGEPIVNIGDTITIKAYLTEYNGSNQLNASLISKVEAPKPDLESLTLSASKTEINENETLTLSIAPNPANADVSGLTYELSDNDGEASLNGNVLTGLKEGSVKVVAKVGGITSNELTITIKKSEGGQVESTLYDFSSMTWSPNSNSYTKHTTTTDNGTMVITNGAVKPWSDDPGVAIGSNGADKFNQSVPKNILNGLGLAVTEDSVKVDDKYYSALYSEYNLNFKDVTLILSEKGEFNAKNYSLYFLYSSDDGNTYNKVDFNKDNTNLSVSLSDVVNARFAVVLETTNGKTRINMTSLELK